MNKKIDLEALSLFVYTDRRICPCRKFSDGVRQAITKPRNTETAFVFLFSVSRTPKLTRKQIQQILVSLSRGCLSMRNLDTNLSLVCVFWCLRRFDSLFSVLVMPSSTRKPLQLLPSKDYYMGSRNPYNLFFLLILNRRESTKVSSTLCLSSLVVPWIQYAVSLDTIQYNTIHT